MEIYTHTHSLIYTYPHTDTLCIYIYIYIYIYAGVDLRIRHACVSLVATAESQAMHISMWNSVPLQLLKIIYFTLFLYEHSLSVDDGFWKINYFTILLLQILTVYESYYWSKYRYYRDKSHFIKWFIRSRSNV